MPRSVAALLCLCLVAGCERPRTLDVTVEVPEALRSRVTSIKLEIREATCDGPGFLPLTDIGSSAAQVDLPRGVWCVRVFGIEATCQMIAIAERSIEVPMEDGASVVLRLDDAPPACERRFQCAGGECIAPVPDGGLVDAGADACGARGDCDGDPLNGCETDLSQTTSCGSCTVECALRTPDCVNVGGAYECGCSCSSPTTCCASTSECVSLQNDVEHCGECERACPTSPGHVAAGGIICLLGECRVDDTGCDDGWGDCNDDAMDGCETNLATVEHCGSCGNACTDTRPNVAGWQCSARSCAVVCAAGFSDCNRSPDDGCEVDDARLCPDCSERPCTTFEVCMAGECLTPVP